MQSEILLASGSPRRFQILIAHGIKPVVVVPDVDEILPEDMDMHNPELIVTYLSRLKAQEVLMRTADEATYYSSPQLATGGREGLEQSNIEESDIEESNVEQANIDYTSKKTSALPRILLACDTLVYNEEIIGKPIDESDAFRILAGYRNKTHEVWSGVTLIDRFTNMEDTFAVCTYITMGDYSDNEIMEYIRTEKPYDKSGAYAIQSSFGNNIVARDGDFENVIGLPWPAVRNHLEKFECR